MAQFEVVLERGNVISCPISEIVDALANGAGNEGQVRRIDDDNFELRW